MALPCESFCFLPWCHIRGRQNQVPCKYIRTVAEKSQKKNSQDCQFDVVFLDLQYYIVKILTVHLSHPIGDEYNLPLPLQLLTVSDDHLNCQYKSRNS